MEGVGDRGVPARAAQDRDDACARTPAIAQDIYIARAEGELALEEELYWALINIYRLPAVMFELTKREKVE